MNTSDSGGSPESAAVVTLASSDVKRRKTVAEATPGSAFDGQRSHSNEDTSSSHIDVVSGDEDFLRAPYGVDETESAPASANAVGTNGETDPMVFVSLFFLKQRLGIAVYQEAYASIELAECFVSTSVDSILTSLIATVSPTQIVAPSNLPEVINAFLLEIASSYSVEYIAPSWFLGEGAKARMANLPIPELASSDNIGDRILRLGSVVELTNDAMISACGGLLQHMDKASLGLERHGARPFPIQAIGELKLDLGMVVDATVSRALQIIKEERHPSVHGIGPAKEGLSLVGLLDQTVSSPGKKLMREWVSRPLLSEEQIETRLDVVAYFVEVLGTTPDVVTELRKSLRQVRDIAGIVARLRTGRESVNDWVSLLQSCVHISKIQDLLVLGHHDGASVPLISEIAQSDLSALNDIVELMGSTIDFTSSREEGRPTVQPGVDNHLDALKQTYASLPDLLSQLCEVELARREGLGALRLVLLAQAAFHFAVPQPLDDDVCRRLIYDGWRVCLTDTQYVYFKTPVTDDLDARVGDIYMQIVTRERVVIQDMTQRILAHAGLLLALHRKLAEVDCLISFAVVSHANHFCRPKVTSEPVLYLTEARHPLMELTLGAASFIPNDTRIACLREGAVKIGCFVSADSALIGITDYIGGRLGTSESVTDVRSSFLSDLNRVGQAIRRTTPRSLVLLDEFGTGTVESDGAGVFAATLRHFLRKREQCPKILATTHFVSICGPRYFPPDPNLEFLSMSVVLQEENGSEAISFLYKLTSGASEGAYARHCAESAGLPKELLVRSQQIADAKKSQQSIDPVSRTRVLPVNRLLETLRNCDPQTDALSALVSQTRSVHTTGH